MIEKIDNGKWIVEAEDAGDGSGDIMVPIPPELMDALGLTNNDEVDMTVLDDGSIIVKRKSE